MYIILQIRNNLVPKFKRQLPKRTLDASLKKEKKSCKWTQFWALIKICPLDQSPLSYKTNFINKTFQKTRSWMFIAHHIECLPPSERPLAVHSVISCSEYLLRSVWNSALHMYDHTGRLPETENRILLSGSCHFSPKIRTTLFPKQLQEIGTNEKSCSNVSFLSSQGEACYPIVHSSFPGPALLEGHVVRITPGLPRHAVHPQQGVSTKPPHPRQSQHQPAGMQWP